MLRIYTRNHPGSFRAQPDKVAKIRNYYSQVRPDGKLDDRFEDTLQKAVEDPGIAVIRKLNDGNYELSGDERDALALLLAIQEYRVPWMRDHMENLVHAMQQKFVDTMIDAPGVTESTLEEIQKDEDPEHHVTAESMRHAFRSGEIFLKKNHGSSLWAIGAVIETLNDAYFGMRWTIYEGSDVPFITSDCPVHKFYHRFMTHLPFRGIMYRRVEVRFPLSHSRMLVLTPDFPRHRAIQALIDEGKTAEAAARAEITEPIRSFAIGGASVSVINAHTVAMAAKTVIAQREMPEYRSCSRASARMSASKCMICPAAALNWIRYTRHPSRSFFPCWRQSKRAMTTCVTDSRLCCSV